MESIKTSISTKDYFDSINKEVKQLYNIASKARKKGFDPSREVEIPPAHDVAARVEGLLGPKGVAKRIRELSEKFEKEPVAFKIAEEIVLGKIGNFKNEEEAADKAVRVALAILTESITAAPLEGIDKVIIRNNFDNTKYLALYLAGPIRAAGGTEAAVTVLITDHVRRALNLSEYKITDDEVERYVEEVELYARNVHLQYPVLPDKIRFAVRHLPIEITGEATEKIEVSGYRNLERIPTNQIRGGAVLVLNDGIVGRAHKLLAVVEKAKIKGWEWLSEISTKTEKNKKVETKIEPKWGYLEDVIAGRPVFSFPMRRGGFRLRYGRSRNTGLAGVGIHPATMFIVDEFLAPGTHIRTERPGKGSIVAPVDSLEGPIVKLKDGTVLKLNTVDEALKIRKELDEILYMGDILIAFGEFLENNHILVPSGYVEEWWSQELKLILDRLKYQLNDDEYNKYKKYVIDPFNQKPDAFEALDISLKFDIALHPKYTYFWNEIDIPQLLKLVKSVNIGNYDPQRNILTIQNNSEIKEILEILGIPHRIDEDYIQISEGIILKTLLELDKEKEFLECNKVLECIKNISNITVKNKAPVFVGARMGRPEKAKARKMSPPVHVLFPVGRYGGTSRSIKKASKSETVRVEISYRICPKCKIETFQPKCPKCGGETIFGKYCSKCNISTNSDKCPKCGGTTQEFKEWNLNLNEIYKQATSKLGLNGADAKAVIGLTSKQKVPELIDKGLLRAKNNVFVYRDGTCRFDMTDTPLTHFTPKEVGVSIEKLYELGYTHDYLGNALKNENQILELKVQDIIIPYDAADYIINVGNFIDDELEKIYRMKRYYNFSKREDILGHLVIGLAPHTSAGMIGRIIGFTTTKGCLAHPFWHASKRRNCDGDEDAIILVLDALINFSKYYLPAQRGGFMDAPLVLSIILDPAEVDDESHNMEVVNTLPLEFYESTLDLIHPKKIKSIIDILEHRIGKPEQYEGFKFSHPTSNINQGPKLTKYKTLETMAEKVEAQLLLAKRIRAVDAKSVAQQIISHHLIRDILGNLRAFTTQKFRCIKCGKSYRRLPLTKTCPKCGGKINLTVYQKSVEKYLEIAKILTEKFDLDEYQKTRIETIKLAIEATFENGKTRQVSLSDFI